MTKPVVTDFDTPWHPDDNVHRIGRTGRTFTFVAPEPRLADPPRSRRADPPSALDEWNGPMPGFLGVTIG